LAPYAKGDFIKVEFTDEPAGESEWVWVCVDDHDDEKRIVFRHLDSERIVFRKLKRGQEIAVGYDMIREHRTPSSFQAQRLRS
jgi:hypothetical protein